MTPGTRRSEQPGSAAGSWSLTLLTSSEPGRRNRRTIDAVLLALGAVLVGLGAVIAESAAADDEDVGQALVTVLGWAPAVWRAALVGAIVLALAIVGGRPRSTSLGPGSRSRDRAARRRGSRERPRTSRPRRLAPARCPRLLALGIPRVASRLRGGSPRGRRPGARPTRPKARDVARSPGHPRYRRDRLSWVGQVLVSDVGGSWSGVAGAYCGRPLGR